MENNVKAQSLKRTLGLSECVTITAGAVIGVGLFTVGSQIVGLMGATVVLASLISFVLILFPSAMYGELGAALPLAGGTYSFAKRAINYPVAVFESWNYTLAQIGIGASESMAFSNYFVRLLNALGMDIPVDQNDYSFIDLVAGNCDLSVFLWKALPAICLFILFTGISYKGVELNGKTQNFFMFFFWACSLVWFATVISKADFSGVTEMVAGVGIPDGVNAFAQAVLLVLWCFFGFETIVGMGSEVKFPQLTIPRALLISPFCVLAVNLLFQWFLCALTPAENIPDLYVSSAPYASAMEYAGIVGLPLVILCLGITLGGDFSTMNPCIAGPARYMYMMAVDGNFPRYFGKVHSKFKTPYRAVMLCGILGIFFILSGSIKIVAMMCAYNQIQCYIIGYISFLMLRRKEPDLKRPWRCPAGTFGAWFSIVTFGILLILAYDPVAIWYNIAWDALAILYYVIFVRKRPIPQEAIDVEALALATVEPTAEEKVKLDSQYKKWRIGAYFFAIAAVLLFAISWIA
ncbi:MAG: APC family permease [Eubacteriales bacterium]|nr:APC family permease [Eubacteriales bacterium]